MVLLSVLGLVWLVSAVIIFPVARDLSLYKRSSRYGAFPHNPWIYSGMLRERSFEG